MENNTELKYIGRQVCVLVPTKDRPEIIEELLLSIERQTVHVGRIIIIASGADIKDTIEKFINKLPIDYFHTNETGQIRQRNIGISKLDNTTKLVACLDDDIVLELDAMSEMIKLWNGSPVETAGIGFNIINGSFKKPPIMSEILLLDHRQPGRVLKSGNSSTISHLTSNIRTQWLNGGTTVWRQDVLLKNKHKEINTKWAIAEDVIFSYPIGKVAQLYVCANAKVNHIHYPYNNDNTKWHYNYGRTQTIWLFHFVNTNKDLSLLLFFFTAMLRLTGKLSYGLLMRRRDLLYFSYGVLNALGVIVKQKVFFRTKKDIREL